MILDEIMPFKKLSFPLHIVRQMFNSSEKFRKILKKISVSESPTLRFFCEIFEIFMSSFSLSTFRHLLLSNLISRYTIKR